MKLDPEKFKPDESRSNHMVSAVAYEDCPLKGQVVCFYTAGFGPANECKHFHIDEKEATCSYSSADPRPPWLRK